MVQAEAEAMKSVYPRSVEYGAEQCTDGVEAAGPKLGAVAHTIPHHGVSRGSSGLPTSSVGNFMPTPEQIRQGCLEIQAERSEAERLRRGAYLKPTDAQSERGVGR